MDSTETMLANSRGYFDAGPTCDTRYLLWVFFTDLLLRFLISGGGLPPFGHHS